MAVRDEMRAGLWVAPDGDSARARPITASSNGREGAIGIDWTPDGRIVYSATTQGNWDIWIANSDGSQPRQLTSDPGRGNSAAGAARWHGGSSSHPARSGASDVRSPADRSRRQQPTPIGTGGGIFRGYLQAIGDHVYFKALEKGWPVAYRVPLAGGPREPLFADPYAAAAAFRPAQHLPGRTVGPRHLHGPTGFRHGSRAPRRSRAGAQVSASTTRRARELRCHLGAGRTGARRPGRPRWGQRTSGASRSTAPRPDP